MGDPVCIFLRGGCPGSVAPAPPVRSDRVAPGAQAVAVAQDLARLWEAASQARHIPRGQFLSKITVVRSVEALDRFSVGDRECCRFAGLCGRHPQQIHPQRNLKSL